MKRALLQGLLAAWLVASAAAQPPELVQLRQRYNGVAARIDSLGQQLEGSALDALTRRRLEEQALPGGMRLVLLFWADDEAEVFLNGFRIGGSRLTPVRVEIPVLYLQAQNHLQVHCWDTDRIESGFMAGLYLEEPDGSLRRVLATGEEEWTSGGEPVQEIFYAHPVPDIPGASVVWSQQLFGQAWLEARFDAQSLRQAASSAPVGRGEAKAERRAMDTHSIVQQLIALQKERQTLEEALAQQQRKWPRSVQYRGYVTDKVVYTLGREKPLEEMEELTTAEELQTWAAQLPAAQQSLVLPDGRDLKGSQAATRAKERDPSAGGEADRRSDYRGPEERGPAPGQAQGGSAESGPGGGAGGGVLVAVVRQAAWLWPGIGVLVLYLVVVVRQNWRIFNGKVWS